MTAVGIDVGKTALDMAVDGKSGVTRFANMPIGIRKLLRQLAAVASPHLVVEATGWRCWMRRPAEAPAARSTHQGLMDQGMYARGKTPAARR